VDLRSAGAFFVDPPDDHRGVDPERGLRRLDMLVRPRGLPQPVTEPLLVLPVRVRDVSRRDRRGDKRHDLPDIELELRFYDLLHVVTSG
jgi:hypothetical protein